MHSYALSVSHIYLSVLPLAQTLTSLRQAGDLEIVIYLIVTLWLSEAVVGAGISDLTVCGGYYKF